MRVNKINTAVYAVRIKNRDALLRSSSGGVFTAFSDALLNSGGAITCAVYDYNNKKTEFKLLTTSTERDTARGSKYMQSIPGDIFSEVYDYLYDNPKKELLFIGLGCQAEGFRKFAEQKGIRDRVYIVDLICHGSASPIIWSQYAKRIEERYNGEIEYLSFREKRKGWPTETAVINGKRIPVKSYEAIYYSRCVSRPSCHVCPFATIERNVDITIGDFWHIEEKIPDFYNSQGTSLVLLHTNRGNKLFDAIKDTIDYKVSNTSECWQYNLEHPTPASEKRSDFWKDYKEHGIDYITKKYGTFTIGTKIKNRLKKIWEVLNSE